MEHIQFHEVGVKSSLQNRKIFKQFLSSLFKSENRIVDRIDIIFCSDKYLLNLNKSYLQHNYYTDTLTFILSEREKAIVGEVYISTTSVRKNAMIFKTPYKKELLRVIIHGCLHLCGYQDKPISAFKKMESLQEKYLLEFVSRET